MAMTKTQVNVNESAHATVRHHSAKVIADTKAWVDAITALNSTEYSNQPAICAECQRHLAAVAMEAAFLGFCKTARLAHVLSAAANAMAKQVAITETQWRAFVTALQLLKSMVVDPFQDFASNVQNVLHELHVQFQFDDGELNELFLDKMEASPEELTTSITDEKSVAHRDLDVYRSSRLDTLDQCREEETWIVSQLAALAEDLASGIKSGHPAARLMHVLKGHKFFNQVDRVCLAGRVAQGNQLVVVDASISERCSENALKKGYSCFVNPEGSLFKMRPGTLRIFADSERVLTSFAKEQKPAQRSIALVADQGLRSGLCLAIGRGEGIQGFLFLNSRQIDLFENITSQFAPLLSLFGLVATIALDTNGFHVTQSDNGRHFDWLPKTAIRFDDQQFLRLVQHSVTMLRGPSNPIELSVVIGPGTVDFMYLPATIVTAVAEMLVRIQSGETRTKGVELKVFVEHGEVRVEFEHGCDIADHAVSEWLNYTISSIGSRFVNKPIKVRLNGLHATVAFPCEPLLFGSNQLLYSTAY